MPPKSPRRWPIWLRIVLVLSLALNLLVVGVVAGAILGREQSPVERLRTARDIAPPPFVLALDPDARRDLVRAFREARPDPQSRKAVRAQVRLLLEELRSEEFDAASVAALLDDQRGRALARQETGASLFVQHLAGLTLAERQAYADRLERALRRGAKR